MKWWRAFHRLPPILIVLIKGALFVALVVLVLFPRLDLLSTQIWRARNPNRAIEPDHPGLAPLEARLRQAHPDAQTQSDIALAVEEVVYEQLPYSWDWETWSVVDYIPSVGEALEKGTEDCDGRAVLAASLLRRMGIPAELRSDFAHVWVHTPDIEVMGPSSAEPAIEITPTGPKVRSHWNAIKQSSSGLVFGVSVFPLLREIILIAGFVLLSLRPGLPARRVLIASVLLLAALGLCRMCGGLIRGPEIGDWVLAGSFASGLLLMAGMLLLERSAERIWLKGRAYFRRSAPALPG